MDEPKSKDGDIYAEKFIFRGIVGQGGIGRVILGFDTDIRREVAIKELRPEKLTANKDIIVGRFIREARVSGQLEHPSIVPVYHLGTKPDGSVFYVMKYVQGGTLGQALDDCFASTPEESFRQRLRFLDNLIAVCDAVAYAHSMGVIHRDIKPGNIILGEFGETVILDWGLAKLSQHITEDEIKIEYLSSLEVDDEDTPHTRDGAILGTPPYMAPEQIDRQFGDVDERSDVYALGVLLFILLAGEKPYKGPAKDTIRLIASDALSPSPRTHGEFIPPELAAICEKAMTKEKEKRFENATEMAKELKAYRSGRMVSMYAYSRMELLKRFVARNKTLISAALAIVLAVIVGAGFSLHFAYNAQRARQRAENALVEITDLSESALAIAKKITTETDDYFETLTTDMQKSGPHNLEMFRKKYPEVQSFKIILKASDKMEVGKAYIDNKGDHLFTMSVPIESGAKKEVVEALIKFNDVTPASFGLDPLKSVFQVWCMQDDGYIIYDEDPKQIGLILFSDKLYANFPELLVFGEKIRTEPLGVSYYSFLSRDDETVVHKVAAWDTIETLGWKIVVTHPYMTK